MTTKPQQRAIVYVDGYNFYYGLKKSSFRKFLWLDFEQLSNKLLLAHQTLSQIKYFTSIDIFVEESRKRQEVYFDALATTPRLQRYMGHFQKDTDRWCVKCKQFVPDTREKRTDVNLATELLVDAFKDRFDVAILVTSDSDYIAPIKSVLAHFPHKRIIVAISPGRSSKALKGVASAITEITEDMLKNSQFTDELRTATGYTLLRPSDWT